MPWVLVGYDVIAYKYITQLREEPLLHGYLLCFNYIDIDKHLQDELIIILNGLKMLLKQYIDEMLGIIFTCEKITVSQ